MKYLYFVALAAVFPTALAAQGMPDRSGLAIVKKQWKVTRVTPPNSVLLEDPFDAIEESKRSINRSPSTPTKNNKERLGQISAAPETTEPPARSDKTLKTTMLYSYDLRVRNDNDKTIRYVLWDYVFFDPETKREVGRHRFSSKVNIKPGQAESMTSKLVSPPTGAIDARTAGKKPAELYIEQIVIRSVEFADGSMWKPLMPK